MVANRSLPRRLLFVVNELHFFISHRLPVAVAARNSGYEVHVATRPGDGAQRLQALGFSHHLIPLSRSGKNPWTEIRLILHLFRLLCGLRPDIVHLVTIKPVLYGGLAARLAKIPGVVAAVSGLGFVFTSQRRGVRLLRGIVTALYRVALKHPNLRVIFQNPTDQSTLVGLRVIALDRTLLVPGSGVDLQQYRELPELEGQIITVVMATRLLKDKGVAEFIGAASQLRRGEVQARFLLVGEPDPGNPHSVTPQEVCTWRESGDVELPGFVNDVAGLFASSHIVVLPSYREGLPKVLLEAAACGRAVVTTDSPGCRDAIIPNVTGLLVPVGDTNELAQAIRRLIEDPILRRRMGHEGRRLAERRFAVERIVEAHLAVYAEVSP